jgi:hypothetical protein
MPKKGWISLIAVFCMFFGIIFGGPQLNAYLFRKYKENIDKNGTIVNALVYLKKSHKGKSTHFRYRYKNQIYRNHEQNSDIYKALEIGDSITILIDSTNPSDSYILSIGKYN